MMDREDKDKLNYVFDLQSWGDTREVSVERFWNKDQGHGISLVYDDKNGKKGRYSVIHFVDDSKKKGEPFKVTKDMEMPGTQWSTLQSGASAIDSLFLKLSRRVEMCRIQKVGIFNMHLPGWLIKKL